MLQFLSSAYFQASLFFSQELRLLKLSRTSLLWDQGPLKLVELSSQEISCWGRTEHSCLHQETYMKKLKSVFQCIQWGHLYIFINSIYSTEIQKKTPTNQLKKSGWEYINPILDRSNTQLSRSLPCKFFSSTFLFKNEATYTLYYPHYPIKLSTKCTCKTCLTCFCMFLLKGE